MNWMKRMFHLCMAALLLMMLCMFSSAMAAEKAATVTLNVTNTPVRGDVLLSKTGLQLVRFKDEADAYGNIVMRPVSRTHIWPERYSSFVLPRTSLAKRAACSTARMI